MQILLMYETFQNPWGTIGHIGEAHLAIHWKSIAKFPFSRECIHFESGGGAYLLFGYFVIFKVIAVK